MLPPNVEPLGGATVVNVGVGVTYVYGWPPDVPLGFSTVTLTPPAACAGELTVIDVSLLIVKTRHVHASKEHVGRGVEAGPREVHGGATHR